MNTPDTNIINFPLLLSHNTLEIETSLTFQSENEIFPNPGEHYFKEIISQEGETLGTINITKEVRALKEKFENTEALTDFVKTVF